MTHGMQGGARALRLYGSPSCDDFSVPRRVVDRRANRRCLLVPITSGEQTTTSSTALVCLFVWNSQSCRRVSQFAQDRLVALAKSSRTPCSLRLTPSQRQSFNTSSLEDRAKNRLILSRRSLSALVLARGGSHLVCQLATSQGLCVCVCVPASQVQTKQLSTSGVPMQLHGPYRGLQGHPPRQHHPGNRMSRSQKSVALGCWGIRARCLLLSCPLGVASLRWGLRCFPF